MKTVNNEAKIKKAQLEIFVRNQERQIVEKINKRNLLLLQSVILHNRCKISILSKSRNSFFRERFKKEYEIKIKEIENLDKIFKSQKNIL